MKPKIGIITLYGQTNYGNRLQNYALQETIRQLGYEVETIAYRSSYRRSLPGRIHRLLRLPFRKTLQGFLGILKRRLFSGAGPGQPGAMPDRDVQNARLEAFREFGELIRLTPHVYQAEEFTEALGEQYAGFVVGSDQVWNPYSRGSRIEFLQFAPRRKRVSYAASFGLSRLPARFGMRYRKGLAGLAEISVREHEGAAIVRRLTGREAPVHPDPTMLLSAEQWSALARPAQQGRPAPYLLTYFLGTVQPAMKEDISRLAANAGLSVFSLNDTADEERYRAGPQDFIALIRDAEVILTDSFHGAVFSVLFEKKFFVFKRAGEVVSGISRITTLFETLGINGRMILDLASFDLRSEVDYSEARRKLPILKEEAYTYLRQALERIHPGEP